MTEINGSRKLDWRKQYEVSTGGCWNWTGSINFHGYGQKMIAKKNFRAHRIFYQKYKGRIPAGLCVLHKCDNKKCVNPEHLFLGTDQDNATDCIRKGRTARGSKQHVSKLNASQVLQIRKDRRPQKLIAKAYGVTPTCIMYIQKRRNWAWL